LQSPYIKNPNYTTTKNASIPASSKLPSRLVALLRPAAFGVWPVVDVEFAAGVGEGSSTITIDVDVDVVGSGVVDGGTKVSVGGGVCVTVTVGCS